MNEDLIIIALSDGKILIYDYNKMKPVKTLSGHSSEITRFCLLSNGDLVSGSTYGEIKVWKIFD